MSKCNTILRAPEASWIYLAYFISQLRFLCECQKIEKISELKEINIYLYFYKGSPGSMIIMDLVLYFVGLLFSAYSFCLMSQGDCPSSIWGLAGSGRTTLPKSSQFLQIVNDLPIVCLSDANQLIQSPQLHFSYQALIFGPLSTCLNQGQVLDN